jgi:hypothetical protein
MTTDLMPRTSFLIEAQRNPSRRLTMKTTFNRSISIKAASIAASAALVLALTGCAGLVTTAPAMIEGPALHGSAFGGRQPIAGATLYLYAASTGNYGTTNMNLLPAGTVTNADGTFNITSAYSCTTGQEMYMVSLGGDTGAGSVNPQAGLLIALGDCSVLHATPFINMNEVTTVGSVFALAPFMTGYASVSTDGGNTPGLQRAFVNANKLMTVGTGAAGGPALPAAATAPTTEIYTLADVLAECVNTTGGTATTTTCGHLFADATPSGGTAPTNTIDLALAIAKNPALNVSDEFSYATPQSPYSTRLVHAPTDWTMSISYAAGFNAPKSTTIDASGQVWVANSGSTGANANSIVTLTQSGAVAQTLTGNGLTTPYAVAIDSNGNAWAANFGSTTVSAFTNGGSTLASYTVGSGPRALAFDAAGNLFVANQSSNSLTELSSSGGFVQTITTGVSSPNAVAIDPK